MWHYDERSGGPTSRWSTWAPRCEKLIQAAGTKSGVGVARSGYGYFRARIAAIFSAFRMVIGLILDPITLPFRIVLALLGGAEFQFRRFSRA